MDLWFGDSWPIGQELGPKLTKIQNLKYCYQYKDAFNTFPNMQPAEGDNPILAFPTLVSNHRKSEFINFAKTASSIEYALFQLITFCSANREKLKSSPESYYTAFLCLTAQIRGFGIDHLTGKQIHYFNNSRKSIDETAIYDSLITINSFYAICRLYNINCVIIPIFCDLLIPEDFRQIVLFKSALLTEISLVELTFGEKFIDNKLYDTGITEHEYYSLLSSKSWITPNKMHPNVIGHKQLAYKLIELLENR